MKPQLMNEFSSASYRDWLDNWGLDGALMKINDDMPTNFRVLYLLQYLRYLY